MLEGAVMAGRTRTHSATRRQGESHEDVPCKHRCMEVGGQRAARLPVARASGTGGQEDQGEFCRTCAGHGGPPTPVARR